MHTETFPLPASVAVEIATDENAPAFIVALSQHLEAPVVAVVDAYSVGHYGVRVQENLVLDTTGTHILSEWKDVHMSQMDQESASFIPLPANNFDEWYDPKLLDRVYAGMTLGEIVELVTTEQAVPVAA